MTRLPPPPTGAPLPWYTEGTTVYDANNSFVLSAWHEDADFIVQSVNALPAVHARLVELEHAVRAVFQADHPTSQMLASAHLQRLVMHEEQPT